MEAIPSVEIDAGLFKYVLIKIHDKTKEESKLIVRGFKTADYHADIYEEVQESIEQKDSNLETECLGGGRIQHDPDKKKILVYGYSMGYGKADHTQTVAILKKHFETYTDITYSNNGY